jgi:hypothetical protein
MNDTESIILSPHPTPTSNHTITPKTYPSRKHQMSITHFFHSNPETNPDLKPDFKPNPVPHQTVITQFFYPVSNTNTVSKHNKQSGTELNQHKQKKTVK